MPLLPSARRIAFFLLLAATVGLSLPPVNWLSAQEIKTLRSFKGHTDPVYAVATTHEGQWGATASFDKSIKLWDLATGKVIRTISGPTGHQGPVVAVAFSPAGDLLASGSADNSARIWEVPATKPALAFAAGAPVRSVAATNDGKQFAAGMANGKIRIWNAEGKQTAELTGHTGDVTGVAFLASGQTVVSTGADRTLRFWALPAGQQINSFGVGTQASISFGLAPNTATAYTSQPGTITAWPTNAPAAKKLADLPGTAKAMQLVANGGSAFVQLADSYQIVNLGNGKVSATFAATTVADSSNDGNTIAHLSGKDQVVLSAGDGKKKSEVALGKIAAKTVALHPQATQLAVGDDQGAIHMWKLPVDAKKPAAPVKTAAHKGAVTHLQYLASGQLLAIGADKAVKILDPNAGKELKTLGTLPAAVTAMVVSPDSSMVAVASEKAIKIWTVADGKETAVTSIAPVRSLAFAPNKTQLLVGTADKSAWLHELPTGKPLYYYPAATAVTSMAFHPNQPLIYWIDDKTAYSSPIPVIKTLSDPALVKGPFVVGQDPQHLISIPTGNQLPLWSLGNSTKEKTLETVSPVQTVAVSKNGASIAVAGGPEGGIHLFTKNDGRLAGSFKTHAKPLELQYHPNNNLLYGRLDNNTAVIWNVAFQPGQPLPAENGSVLQSFNHPAAVTEMQVVGDGSQLLTGCEDGQVRVWKLASEPAVKSFSHPNLVDAVAFDPSGKILATACHDGNVRLFDVVKGGQPTKTIAAHIKPTPNPIYAVIWSPDGKTIATASFDHSIKFWDAADGKLIREIRPGSDHPPVPAPIAKASPALLGSGGGVAVTAPPSPGHLDQVFSLAFSKDGKKLASASSDRTVKLWDVATGDLIRSFANPAIKPSFAGEPAPAHPGFVYSVRFLNNDTQLVSVGPAPRNSGYVAVWNIADGKIAQEATLPVGPIYTVEPLFASGSFFIGCGPQQRNQSDSEAHLIVLPKK